jgi:uncharacterized membrane protein
MMKAMVIPFIWIGTMYHVRQILLSVDFNCKGMVKENTDIIIDAHIIQVLADVQIGLLQTMIGVMET